MSSFPGPPLGGTAGGSQRAGSALWEYGLEPCFFFARAPGFYHWEIFHQKIGYIVNMYIYTYIHRCIHRYIDIHTLHCIALHYSTVQYITVQYITLQYSTLHYIHIFIYIYMSYKENYFRCLGKLPAVY